MATPEGRVKEMVKRALKEEFDRRYLFMPVQNGMGAPALDLYNCIDGLFVAIETKAPGKTMTPRQLMTAKDIADAGGLVFEVSCAAHMVAAIDVINLTLTYRKPRDPVESP